MKHHLNPWITFIVTGFILVRCSSDEEPDINREIPNDPFAASLEARLEGNTIGYSYVILRDGEVAVESSGGVARNSTDGESSMMPETSMHIASISKFLTTVATLSLMEDYDITPTEPIDEFLPSDWEQGPGIEDLTILDLLSQEGGLNQYGTQSFGANYYDSLEIIIASGAENPNSKFYSNTHHSLFRVILPIIQDQQSGVERTYNDLNTALAYDEIIRQELFEPTETHGNLNATFSDVAYVYATPNDRNSGIGGTANFLSVGGAYGWHVSAADLSEIWRTVWYTEELISIESRQLMEENTAGLFDSYEGRFGFYYIKNGFWNYGGEPRREQQTVAIHFPDNTDVIVYVNSGISGTFSWITPLAVNAYEESILLN